MTIPTIEERTASAILAKTPEGVDRFAAWLSKLAPMSHDNWRNADYFTLPTKFFPQSEKGLFVKAALESLRVQGFNISDYHDIRASVALNERLLKEPVLKRDMQDAALLYQYGKLTKHAHMLLSPAPSIVLRKNDPLLTQHETGVASIIAQGIAPTYEPLLTEVTDRLAAMLGLTKAQDIGHATARESLRVINGGRIDNGRS